MSKNGFFAAENLRSLAVLVLIILAVRWSVASPYKVPTASMEPTIKVGDRLLGFKLAYGFKVPFMDSFLVRWSEVEKGDIIVFRYPPDPSIDYVKRVVAVPGDTIEVREDILHINGVEQPRVATPELRQVLDDIGDPKDLKILFREKMAEGDKDYWVMQNIPSARPFAEKNWPSSKDKPFVVPEGKVFCMGDNRDNSTDSRVWGLVPMENIRGKALFVIWSAFSPRDSSWFRFRFDRFGHWLDG